MVEEHLVDYWTAFKDLDRQRTYSHAPQPITDHAVICHAELYGFRGEDRQMLLELVHALDVEYLHQWSEKRQKELEKSRGNSQGRRRS